MSLTRERLEVDLKIKQLQKDRASLELTFDCTNTTLRMETSPSLTIEQVDIDKVVLCAEVMAKTIDNIRNIDAEIIRLVKLL